MVNGATPEIQMVDPIVDLLTQALAAYRGGQFNTIAVVTISPQGAVTPLLLGPRLADAHLGLIMLADDIKAAIRAPKNQSRILRPGIVG